jgi:chromosome segregation ATPase
MNYLENKAKTRFDVWASWNPTNGQEKWVLLEDHQKEIKKLEKEREDFGKYIEELSSEVQRLSGRLERIQKENEEQILRLLQIRAGSLFCTSFEAGWLFGLLHQFGIHPEKGWKKREEVLKWQLGIIGKLQTEKDAKQLFECLKKKATT